MFDTPLKKIMTGVLLLAVLGIGLAGNYLLQEMQTIRTTKADIKRSPDSDMPPGMQGDIAIANAASALESALSDMGEEKSTSVGSCECAFKEMPETDWYRATILFDEDPEPPSLMLMYPRDLWDSLPHEQRYPKLNYVPNAALPTWFYNQGPQQHRWTGESMSIAFDIDHAFDQTSVEHSFNPEINVTLPNKQFKGVDSRCTCLDYLNISDTY